MTFVGFFKALASENVQYCMLGRTAAFIYGLPVTTVDVDILLAVKPGNALRFFRALKKLKVISQLPNKMELELFETQKVTRFRIGDFALDVLKWQEGFSEASWRRVRRVRHGGVTVRIADLHDLIETKAQSPRRKDQADVRALRKLLKAEKSQR